MDRITFNSNYVKMFLLGIYDKNLFDLVIKTPHSRVHPSKIAKYLKNSLIKNLSHNYKAVLHI